MNSFTQSPLVNNCIATDTYDVDDKILVRKSQLQKAAELVKALEDENRYLKEQVSYSDIPSTDNSSHDFNHLHSLEEENKQLQTTILKLEAHVATANNSVRLARMAEQQAKAQLSKLDEKLVADSSKYKVKVHDLTTEVENLSIKNEGLQRELHLNTIVKTTINTDTQTLSPRLLKSTKLIIVVTTLLSATSLVLIWI
ncbi:hypothetical protein GEMRC1_001921 [Eukaryota sp. GEM-RC1]